MSIPLSNSDYLINLSSESAALPPTKIRLAVAVLALVGAVLNLYNLFHDHSASDVIMFLCLLSAFTVAIVLLIKHARKEIQLTVTDSYIRSIDDGAITRTAYFSQVHFIKLTGCSIHVKYAGGAKERLLLPSHSDKEYQSLKNYLQKAAADHSFTFKEKYQWF